VFAEKLPRFSSEYGFQAFPPMSTIKAFTDPADRSLFNPILLVHQKHPIGNELIQEYMERDYPVPTAFEDVVYVSQLLQARGMRTAFEAHRRAMPRTMGTLYWQLNDTWPVVSWSGLDYFGRWKALHYAAREAFAPLLLSPTAEGDTLTVWGTRDGSEGFEGTLNLKLMDFRGTVLWEAPIPVSLPGGTSRALWSISVEELLGGNDPAQVVLRSTLDDASSLFYFRTPKELSLETPAIELEWEETEGGAFLTLTSDVLAKDVYLTLVGPEGEEDSGNAQSPRLSFSDNFFDLLPRHAKVISIQGGWELEDLQSALRIRTLAEVPREGVPAIEGGEGASR
jgi:beta-mannosidase